jgi:hypothetical protein
MTNGVWQGAGLPLFAPHTSQETGRMRYPPASISE